MKSLFLCIACLLVFNGFGQVDFLFTEAKELNSEKVEVISTDDKVIFLLNNEFNFTISKTDIKTLNKIFDIKLEIPNKDNKEYYYPSLNRISTTFLNNEIQIVYDVWNKKEEKKVCYIKTLTNTGILSQAKELSFVECKSAGANGNTIYQVIYSPDKSKFALLLDNYTSGIIVEPTITIYDTKKQTLLATKKLKSLYNGSKIQIDPFNSFSIDNSGNINLEFSTREEKTNKIIKKHEAVILFSETVISNIKEQAVAPKTNDYSHSTKSLKIKNETQILSGFYNNKTVSGVFFKTKDLKTNKIQMEIYTPFNDDIKYKLAQGNEKNTDEFIIAMNLLEMNDAYYLICNRYYSITATNVRGGTAASTSKEFKVYRELIITKFNNTGKLEWQKIIQKNNVNTGSFDVLADNGKINIIFLEHEKNEKQTEMDFDFKKYEECKNAKESNVVCFSFNEEGVASKKIIFKNPERGFCYTPENLQIKAGKTILTTYKSVDQTKLGSITLK